MKKNPQQPASKKVPFTAHSGYGLALLLIFVASTILIGTSMSLILTPSVAGYLNTASIDNSSAKQIALIALDAAQNDIFTKLSTGIAVNTSYRLPSSGTTTVTMPNYPGSGSTTSIGSYFVTVKKARGYTYILSATASSNNASITISKLVQLGTSYSILPNNYPFAAYALRKLIPSYSGNAVNVRCASNPNGVTTTDIGFTASGDFDLSTLQSCLGDTILPLDLDSSAKAAYGLRKLKASYTGKLITIRSSAGGTKDIGFDANGRLDTYTLMSFVGSNSAYITTWYDQSGNNKHLTQTTTSMQPRIVNAGVLDTQNNAPSIHFDYTSSQYLVNTAMTGYISGVNLTAFMVSEIDSGSSASGRIAILHKTGDNSDYNTATSMQILSQVYNHTDQVNDYSNTQGAAATGLLNILLQTTSIKSSGSQINLYVNNGSIIGSKVDAGDASSNSLAPDYLVIGAGRSSSTISDFFSGYVDELIIYNNDVAVANRQAIERSQGHYYNVLGVRDGYVTTWYDQNGHGYNLTQTSSTAQPIIDITGLKAAVLYDVYGCSVNYPSSTNSANCDYLNNATLSATYSPLLMTVFGVGSLSSTAVGNNSGHFISLYKTGTSDNNNASSVVPIMKVSSGSAGYLGSSKHDSPPAISVALNYGQDFQTTSMADGATRTFRSYQTSPGLLTGTSTANAAEGVVINNIRMGLNDGLNSNAGWDGRMYEAIVYMSVIGTSSYQKFETNERTYYGL